MKDGSNPVRRVSHAVWIIAIIVVSTAMAMIITWRAPGLNLYARDRLMQARGPLSPPDDVVIVAIDEASITRFGQFPWPRTLTARALDSISSTQPKAIALDILYSEPTTSADDTALAEAIKRSGNTVIGAQLIEAGDGGVTNHSRWLRPLALFENSASGLGHVNVSPEGDGTARELPLRKADDDGHALWAIAVETIRVGDGVRADSVHAAADNLRLGSHTIPVAQNVHTLRLASQNAQRPVDNLQPARMAIDYVGPPGSFSHQTYSFAEVLDGRVQPQSFRGKYILIGATAATLGDHLASPFVHTEGPGGMQHGELMPGVEILANSINTILRSRFYRDVPDLIVALLAALVAAAVLGSLSVAQGRLETVKQIGALFGLLAFILVSSYIAFAHFLVVLPVVALLVSFATAAPLALLRRSINASTDLDERIFELTEANELLPVFGPELVATNNFTANPAALIARLTGASAVAIYLSRNGKGGRYRLAASFGAGNSPSVAEDELQDSFSQLQSAPHSSITDAELPPLQGSSGNKLTAAPAQTAGNTLSPLKLRLGWTADSAGALLIGPLSGREIDSDTLRLCVEIAVGYLARVENEASAGQPSSLTTWRHYFPRGIEWKTRALGLLNRRLLARARFVDRALRSAEEGLIVADISGCIAFANPRAAEILGIPERGLIGSDLFWRMKEMKDSSADSDREGDRIAREVLLSLVIERSRFESEFQVKDTPPRYCVIRLSAVTSGEDGTGQILGLVATLSDVTQQREFEGMKTDVMTLVTHELRTPLTAIQGMSEVLAQFEVDSERRREMHLAINEEAKRLSHMINEYLDITRLESGARSLRLAPVSIGSLIERTLLLLEPVAAQRHIRIARRLAPNLPGLLADADLIAQALTNLIANAIKYSPVATEIIVAGHSEADTLLIEVTDHGYGIPTNSLGRIFEKFYRVPRVEDADVPGTGLGLSLVREIVELHGGRIAVESELEVGSTFSVYLPLQRKEN